MPNFSNPINLPILQITILIVSHFITSSISRPQDSDSLIAGINNDDNLIASPNQLSDSSNSIINSNNNNLQNSNNINNIQNQKILTDQTLDSEICLTHQIQEKCHTCSQREFQLNVDECARTHQIEKISCHDRDNRETILIRSCSASYEVEDEGLFSFVFTNFILGLIFFYVSRRRQRFLDERRNRKLQTQLQAL